MKKIAYLTGTRAEFGLMRSILTKIKMDKKLELILLATGMHLMDQFGHTITEVDKEFKSEIIEAVYLKDDRESMARFLGKCTTGVVKSLVKHKPEVVMVMGDRAEQLAMASAAAYLAIPVVHFHGGEQTTTIDDKARDAISQLSDWHLPATKLARKRLIKMGINKRCVRVVGAPGLEEIKALDEIDKKFQVIVLQHPDENELKAARQMETTLKAALQVDLPIKVIYPNADAGGRAMIKVIKKYAKQFPEIIEEFKSLKRSQFLKLLNQSKVLVGNSSAGLIESPSLGINVVNVGPRQNGREKASNVIDVPYDQDLIMEAIKEALRMKNKRVKNPYGDGKTSKRVIKFLKKL